MPKVIELQKISAGYDNEIILNNIDLTVFDYDFIGIIGPNGGGKTTLLKVILKVLKPFSGNLIYHGNVSGKSGVNIGYLPQLNQIDRRFPIHVIDVVLSGLMSNAGIFSRYSGKSRVEAEKLLNQMGINDLKNKPIGELSGGQLQRVYLCRAIISSPRLLMLDEPNTFVDTKFETDFYEILKELNKKMAIIVVSHDVGTISWYVKTIACVNKNLHYHPSNKITEEQLAAYNCPIQIITHGNIPHTVLETHNHNHA